MTDNELIDFAYSTLDYLKIAQGPYPTDDIEQAYDCIEMLIARIEEKIDDQYFNDES